MALQGNIDGVPGELPSSSGATVWFLGMNGWALRIDEVLFVFDYQKNYGPGRDEDPARHGLADGFINPAEIAGLDVYVFVTHEHSDHFDDVIFSWQEEVRSLTYFMGWAQDPVPHCRTLVYAPSPCHTLAGPRARVEVGPLSVHTINSHHSGVDEVAYLIRFQDWVFYLNGDYKADYREDYPYMAGFESRIDAAFLGAEPDTSDQYFHQALSIITDFGAPVVFGQHFGDEIDRCRQFASALAEASAEATVHCPELPGQRFQLSK
jgi:L-ascorbate metabolism protein UlaG (beta-lactamase superfamily)